MEANVKKIWDRVMAAGRKHNRGQVNKFDEEDITTIIATMEFFGATPTWMKQTCWDLKVPKYKGYDWLAMCVMGRNDDDRKTNTPALKVLCHSFLKVDGDERAFIADLRETDYQVDESWESIEVA